jgi:aminoglycoside phosphotransferase (APT) family kinase protein
VPVAAGRRELDLDALEAFLDEHGLGHGPVIAAPVGEGRSNMTFRLTRDDTEFALRRPPYGPLPPRAHDVLREGRVLTALRATTVPVPTALATCENPAVIGGPFVVTEWLDGVVISAHAVAALDHSRARQQIGACVVEALLRIHETDPRSVGLDGLGRPDGYLERQVQLHLRLWKHHRTRALPLVDELGTWLLAHLPRHGQAALVHGDFRLGNLMFARHEPTRIIAVLDWELATIGDPMVDLGYLCACWTQQSDPEDRAWQPDPATRGEGGWTRRQLVESYTANGRHAVHDLRWYVVLALWRGVIFMEGNYRRAVSGATEDPFLLAFGARIPQIAELALRATVCDDVLA